MFRYEMTHVWTHAHGLPKTTNVLFGRRLHECIAPLIVELAMVVRNINCQAFNRINEGLFYYLTESYSRQTALQSWDLSSKKKLSDNSLERSLPVLRIHDGWLLWDFGPS